MTEDWREITDPKRRGAPTRERLCTLGGARLIAVSGGQGNRIHRLAEKVVIGRDPSVQIFVDASDVSRRHAQVEQKVDGSWTIEDLGSRNGTSVNGVKIGDLKPLAFGDWIELGASTVFIFAQHDEFQEQLGQLQKMEAIGQLAGGVAHDFNNMLSVVQANVDYLERLRQQPAIDREEMRVCLEELRTVAQDAAELTVRLLGFARRGEAANNRVDLSALVAEVVQLCRRTFDRNVEIRADLPPGLRVTGNRSELHQALMNLCLNARDAMPSGGRLTIRGQAKDLAEHEVPLLPAGPYVSLAFVDTGVGMDEQTRQRLFEPFYTTKGEGGTGLGLATVYGTMRRHGGHVGVTSSPGAGSTFSLYLPLARETSDEVQVTARGENPWLAAQAEQHNLVLVVDDEETILSSTRRLLEAVGLRAICARGGARALDLYREHRPHVQLVLLDLIMPKMDGAETFRRLRELDPGAPVLLISGHPQREVVEEMLAAGALGFLPKPYDAERLRAAVGAALERAERATRTTAPPFARPR